MIDKVEAIVSRAARSYRPDERFLAILRMAYGLWAILMPVDLLWMASVPDGFVNARPGLFAFVDSVPPIGVLVAISAMRFVLAVLLVLGVFTLPVSVLLTAVMITASGLAYSFSKVDHFILFELVPVFLAFAGWGRTWSIDAWIVRRRGRPTRESDGLPVLLFALTLGWGMLTAAIPKIRGGWLDPSRQATRGYVASDVAIGDKPGPLGEWLLPLDSDLFWKALDYATIAAEGLLILLVLTPLLYRLWLVLLACFHIGVYLTLGISFADYILVYAVFFSPAVMWGVFYVRERLRLSRDRGEVAP